MKFASKLLLIFLSFIVLTSGAVVYTVYRTTLGNLKNQIHDKLEEQAANSLDKIDRMLFERRADITILTTDPIIASRDSSPERITERLLVYRNTYKTYASLSFFDLERVRIADTAGMHVGRKHDPVPWMREVFDNHAISVAKDIRQAEELKTTVVYFAAPVKDKEEKTFAAVVARMPIEKLYEAVAMAGGIHKGEREKLKVDLVDRDGLLLYSSYNRKGILKSYGRDWETIKKSMGTRSSGILDISLPEKTSMVEVFAREEGYLDFEGNGWTLLLHIPEKIAFAPVAKLRNRVLIIFGAVSFLSLLIILFLSRAVSRPLVALKDAALEAGKGNFAVRIETGSQDEIGQLASAFNSMAKSLKDSYGKINAQNKFLKDVLESITHPFYVVNVHDYSIVKANSAAGSRAPEISKCFAFAHGEDAPCQGPGHVCPMEEMRKTRKPVTVEHVHYDKDKNKKIMEIHAYPLFDEAGELVYMIEYALDISERKQMERDIMESESRFRTMISNIPGVFYRCANDPDWTMEFISSGTEEIAGYPPSDFIHGVRSWASIIHPDDREMVDRKVQEGVNHRKSYVIEYRVYHVNGEIRWVYEKGQGVFDDHGGLLHLDGAILDVTSEKILKEQNKLILETTSDGFWILDIDGRLREVNDAYCRMTGYTREELLSMRIPDLEAAESLEETAEHIKKVTKEGSDFFETKHRRKDGKIFDVEVIANFMDIEGGRVFSFTRDITERKRVEKCLSNLNETFVHLGPDYNRNVQLITEACGSITGAVCALYNKVEGGLLCSIGQWRTPGGFNPVDKPEGHICHDLIKKGKGNGVTIIRNLPETGYYKTDPNVAAYGLKTYIGHAVNCGGKTVGSLCAVFQEDVELGASEDTAIGMLAKALENEEERRQAREELEKINKDLEATQNASLNIMTDLDRQRKELDKSLREKEALIREVHHRVKNNMQVISSLLKLQSYHIEDPAMQTIFKDSVNRIKSMALVHERLYRTEDLAHIDFGEYIRNLAVDIFHSFGANASHVRLHVDAEDITLPIDTAIPCGLIINELITNALKYAFPGGRKGELVIEMRRREEGQLTIDNRQLKIENPQSTMVNSQSSIELIVRDNGVGMPEDLDFKTAHSLGLNLVTSLAKQIRGEIELNREGGTEWRIRFGEKSQ